MYEQASLFQGERNGRLIADALYGDKAGETRLKGDLGYEKVMEDILGRGEYSIWPETKRQQNPFDFLVAKTGFHNKGMAVEARYRNDLKSSIPRGGSINAPVVGVYSFLEDRVDYKVLSAPLRQALSKMLTRPTFGLYWYDFADIMGAWLELTADEREQF